MKEQAYLEQNRDKHLAELNEWLSIPSISAISEHKEDVQRAAQWQQMHLHVQGWKMLKLFKQRVTLLSMQIICMRRANRQL